MRPCFPGRCSVSRRLARSMTLKKRPRAVADERPGARDGQMRLARSRSADEDGVALVGDEDSVGEVADQGLIDRGVGKFEVVDVLGPAGIR